jgi:hypothetical protein
MKAASKSHVIRVDSVSKERGGEINRGARSSVWGAT